VQHKVRLAGIDAPEKAQAFGERSKQNLSALVFGKDVRADCNKRDRYGRDVCRVWVTPLDCPNCELTLDVALAQLTIGLAWHYKRFENEQTPEERGQYSFAEDEARAALALRRKKVRRGSSMCVPPKVVRHADRPLPDSISKSLRAKSPECLLVGPLTLRVDRAMSTAAIKWQG